MCVDVAPAESWPAWAARTAAAENAETTALRLIAALILDPDTLRQRSLVWWLQLLLKPALAFPAQQARTGAAPPRCAAVVESCIHVNRVRLATLLVHGYARVVRERLQPSRWNQLPTRIAPALSGEDAKLQKGFAYLAFALGRRMAARADDSVQLWEPPLRVVARSASRFAGLGSSLAESQAQSDGAGRVPDEVMEERNNSFADALGDVLPDALPRRQDDQRPQAGDGRGARRPARRPAAPPLGKPRRAAALARYVKSCAETKVLWLARAVYHDAALWHRRFRADTTTASAPGAGSGCATRRVPQAAAPTDGARDAHAGVSIALSGDLWSMLRASRRSSCGRCPT